MNSTPPLTSDVSSTFRPQTEKRNWGGIKPPRRIRVANALIDNIIVLAATIGINLFIQSSVHHPASGEYRWLLSMEAVFLITFVLYHTLFEGLLGRTLGKVLTGTKLVRRSDPRKVGLGLSFLRTLIRLIPFEWVTVLSPRRLCLHDLLTGTRVVAIVK